MGETMTKKLIASLGALFLLYCSMDVAAAGGGIAQQQLSASGALGVEAPAHADLQKVATTEVGLESTEPTPMDLGDMSDAEKERRKQVCDNQYDVCLGRCKRYFPKKPDERRSCEKDCFTSYTDCLKHIR